MGMPLHPVNYFLLGDAPGRAPLLARYKPSLYGLLACLGDTYFARKRFRQLSAVLLAAA
jgi:hypothetical protein